MQAYATKENFKPVQPKVWVLTNGLPRGTLEGNDYADIQFATIAGGNGYLLPDDRTHQSHEIFFYGSKDYSYESYNGTKKRVGDFVAQCIDIVYPSEVGGFYRYRVYGKPEYTEIPSEQQVADAEYIVSSFALKQ